ncbi:MAG: hypothetical protein IPL84_08740 [Chitinophagaceae bacterium]|nr:hypothetical protein [Chitinophagaceae bacterium]
MDRFGRLVEAGSLKTGVKPVNELTANSLIETRLGKTGYRAPVLLKNAKKVQPTGLWYMIIRLQGLF